jgi:hypothetical protein
MKKTLISLLLLFTLTLAACGAPKAQAATGNFNGGGNSAGTGNGNSFGTAPLPLAEELMIGTFKLEGTPNAVTAQEAAQLITLWQVYKDLTSSSSAAQQEIDSLAQQIQGAMTPAQVQAITAMKLTRRDIFQTMTDLGIAPQGGPRADGTPRPGGGQGGGGNFQPGGGNGVPGGGNGAPGGGNGAPGGGNGAPGFNGQNLSPQQIATFQARRAQGGGGFANRIPTALYDALIKLLQNKK